jgi:hypothetical protein
MAVLCIGIPVRAHDAVARDDQRDRVAAECRPGGADGPWAARLRGHGAIGRGGTVADPGRGLEHAAAEAGAECPVDREVEPGPLAVEVLLQLASGGVEAGGCLEEARGDPRRQLLQDRVGDLVLIGQPDDPRRRGGDEETAERAVHSSVGDVQEPVALGSLDQSCVQPLPGGARRSDRLAQSLFDLVVGWTHRGAHDRGSRLSMRLEVRPRRSVLTASKTFRRAASELVSIASPMSA